MNLVTTNAREVVREFKQISKDYTIKIQQALSEIIDDIRKEAAEVHIIPNDTGQLNPYRARKKQPSTDGRLTSRTGKLKYMLLHKIDKNNWKGFGKTLVKHDSSGLKGQIRRKRINVAEEHYEGTLRVWVTMDGRLTSTYMGMPTESTRTLAMRFMWEYRNPRRPFIEPAAKSISPDMTGLLSQKINRIKGWV